MKTKVPKKNLILVISFLALVLAGSLIAMWFIRQNSEGSLVAYIYQDGELLHRIPLNLVTAPYTINVSSSDENIDGPGGDAGTGRCFNQIEVRPGSIGITKASCPDKLCVHMGFQDTPMVPIVCLPNKVVIQLRIEGENETDNNKLDGISY